MYVHVMMDLTQVTRWSASVIKVGVVYVHQDI